MDYTDIPHGHRACLFTPKLIKFHIEDTTSGAMFGRKYRKQHYGFRGTLFLVGLGVTLFVMFY